MKTHFYLFFFFFLLNSFHSDLITVCLDHSHWMCAISLLIEQINSKQNFCEILIKSISLTIAHLKVCVFELLSFSIFFDVLPRSRTCLNNMYRMNTRVLVNLTEPWRDDTLLYTEWSNSDPQSTAALLHPCYHSCMGTHVLMHSSNVQALKSPRQSINSICAMSTF